MQALDHEKLQKIQDGIAETLLQSCQVNRKKERDYSG